MKGKKLASFIIVSIIAIICIFVIAGAIVPKNLSFEFDEPSSIKILNAKTGNEMIMKNSDEYDEIVKLFNNGFKVQFLEAFFQGKGFHNISTLDETQDISSLSKADTLYIEFGYSEAKQVNLHGDTSLELADSEKTYKSVVLEVKNSNNLVQVNAYLKIDSSSSYSYVRYTSYAKLSALYDYLNEKFEFNS